MTDHLKTRLFGGGAVLSPSIHHQRLGAPTMIRGPMIPRSPDDGGGDDDHNDDPPPQTVDKAAHDALVAAHERLKRDSRADRTELRDLRAKVTNLEAELEAEQAKHDDTDKSTALAAQKAAADSKLADEVGKRDKTIADLQGELNDSAAETALDKALDEHRVKPELRKAAKAMLRSNVVVEADDGKRAVYLNDLPIDQAVKAWAEGEEGKIFILDGNSGGGAGGGSRSYAGKNPWKSDQRNLTEQDRIEKNDPSLARRLKAEAGVA